MENLNIVEIKSFIPAKDYELSKQFYQEAGFEMASDFGDVAYFFRGKHAFLLQNFYEPEHCHNFMMHLLVEDVQSWHQHLSQLNHDKFGSRLTDLVDQPWGMREFCLFDPSGALWRIAQNV